ncbi:hypothetical protein FIU83_07505 [Halomonas sp. THAF5a]|uniref:prepilin-type N-terminal cleavage/methylation domain-containing protein n=1 Tax=Halomonas sp. THAF5a TaxID=2587844 RepID=UPI001267B89A|nr:prepilin-type N-terminal cleavage/methylation domain-containing protein [Halomonas sp. THAF5a]QFU01484.1 hypothetical protein FIU83_07505 [Halomonas sp. THAF5a]
MNSVNAFAARQRGATLVELMVALVLGLLVVARATQMYSGMRQTFALASDVSARQAGVGFITQQLLRHVRTAEAIEIDGEALTLTMNGDQGATYCGATQTSLALTYRRDGETLRVEPDCPSAGSVLMTGIEGFVPEWAASGEPYGVSLSLTLAETDHLPARTLTFHAVGRELALRQALSEKE